MHIKRQLNRFWLSPAAGNAIFPSIVLLIFRLGFGWDLIATASWGHLGHPDLLINNFTQWGVPFPKASFYFSAYVEMICGGLLMLGLVTRFATIPLIINFLVAFSTASRAKIADTFAHGLGQVPQNLAWNIIEDTAFPFLLLGLLLLAFGAGAFSVDRLIAFFLDKRPLTWWRKLFGTWWLTEN